MDLEGLPWGTKDFRTAQFRFNRLINQISNKTVHKVTLEELGLLLCYSHILEILGEENQEILLDRIYNGTVLGSSASSSSASSSISVYTYNSM